jgi:transposase-like protein
MKLPSVLSNTSTHTCTLAIELRISPESLRRWSIQNDVEVGTRNGATRDEREELRDLRRVTMERDIPKKGLAFIAAEENESQ